MQLQLEPMVLFPKMEEAGATKYDLPDAAQGPPSLGKETEEEEDRSDDNGEGFWHAESFWANRCVVV